MNGISDEIYNKMAKPFTYIFLSLLGVSTIGLFWPSASKKQDPATYTLIEADSLVAKTCHMGRVAFPVKSVRECYNILASARDNGYIYKIATAFNEEGNIVAKIAHNRYKNVHEGASYIVLKPKSP